MSRQTGLGWRRLLATLACLAIASSVAVLVVRIWAVAHSAAIPPGTAQTSGCEEESMFAVWRAARHVPVYCDPTKPPYASAYFNWLFYTAYGAVAGLAKDASLVLAGRCLTALGAVAGAILLGVTGWRCGRSPALRLTGIAVGSYLFLGPLVGWWAVTLRPDVGGLFFETAAIILFLLLHRRSPRCAVLLSIALLYLAWAFKPINLGALCAVAGFLLVHRRWKEFALLAGGSAGLWGASLVFGGQLYRMALLETATDNQFSLRVGLANASHAAICMAPAICFLPWWGKALFSLKPWKQRSFAGDAMLLCSLGLPVVAAVLFAASCKNGAGSNYYFSAAMLLTIGVVLGVFPTRTEAGWPAALSCALIVALQGGLLAGRFGKLSLDDTSRELAARWESFDRLPEPRFSSDLRLNLPWLDPHSPSLALAYNYAQDREHGRIFVGGGLGSMIVRGEFASLMLPTTTGDVYDGASLDGYVRGETIAGLTVFRRGPPRNGR